MIKDWGKTLLYSMKRSVQHYEYRSYPAYDHRGFRRYFLDSLYRDQPSGNDRSEDLSESTFRNIPFLVGFNLSLFLFPAGCDCNITAGKSY